MSVFVDTSALLSVLDSSEPHNEAASIRWRELVDHGESLVTTNYVAIEAIAVVQNRLGVSAVRDLADAMLSIMEIVWIDRELHERALAALFATGRRKLSMVDCTSFEVMRARGLRTVFAFDRHFREQGFQTIP